MGTPGNIHILRFPMTTGSSYPRKAGGRKSDNNIIDRRLAALEAGRSCC